MARTVLLVDDEPLVLEVLAAMLEDMGCDVISAASGTEALGRLAGNQQIEILITDINMPGLNGLDLVERAKCEREDLRVIMMSGQETKTPGFPFLKKPFLEQDLVNIMERTTGLC